MGCQTCGKKKDISFVNAVCSVCEETLNDTSVKKVFWCETCKAYICAIHQRAIGARAVAATKVAIKKVINFIKR